MYQQFADRLYTEMRILHAPDLTGCQWLPTSVANHPCLHGFMIAALRIFFKNYSRNLCASSPQPPVPQLTGDAGTEATSSFLGQCR
jgi:hypothetical protein